MALGRSYTLVQTDISIGWVAMTCCTDIQHPQRMNPDEVVEHLNLILTVQHDVFLGDMATI